MNFKLLIIGILYFFLSGIVKGQNVGIGTSSPLAPLHLVSNSGNPIRIEAGANMYLSWFESGIYRGYLGSYSGNPEDVDFGTGSGNGTGKVHLTIQASPKLTIRENGFVGINTTNPLYQLDVNGNTRLGGQLFSGGTAGTAGQILTSNGIGAPAWQTLNTAFENNTRFGVKFERDGTTSGAMNAATSYYNLNNTNVTVNPTSITINKTGLYHLEGNCLGYLTGTFSALPEMNCFMGITPPVGTPYFYEFLTNRIMPLRPAFSGSYSGMDQFSIDMQITAGTTLTFNIEYVTNATPSTVNRNLKVYGYLVSE